MTERWAANAIREYRMDGFFGRQKRLFGMAMSRLASNHTSTRAHLQKTPFASVPWGMIQSTMGKTVDFSHTKTFSPSNFVTNTSELTWKDP
jgi:hypothetical protein